MSGNVKVYSSDQQEQRNAPTPALTERNPANICGLEAPSIDKALEQNFQLLATTTVEGLMSWERVSAVTALREQHNNPQVASRLAELMMTAGDRTTRYFAEQALVGTTDPKAAALLVLEQKLRNLGNSQREVTESDLNDLEANRADPLVSKRLVELVVSGCGGPGAAYHAANVLRRTPDRATQDALKDALRKVVEGGDSRVPWVRTERQHLPRALKGSVDTEVHALLVKAFSQDKERWNDCSLVSACARALGGIKTEPVKKLLLDSVFEIDQDWKVRCGVIEALKEQMDESIKSKLTPLIEGPAAKTAWLIAGQMSSSFAGRCRAWLQLISNCEAKIYAIRVGVALTLAEQQPELARRALLDATRGYKCEFFAKHAAVEGLERLK
jgi:hypothetical protein